MKGKLINESLYDYKRRHKVNEGFATRESRDLDEISRWCGYDDFAEFIGDNPGCFGVIVEWIDEQFNETIGQNCDDLEKLNNSGLYRSYANAKEDDEDDE